MHIDLIKGRVYPIGTVRTWKDGSKYKKVAVGKWVEIEDRGSIIKEIQGLLRKAISALTRLKLLSKDYERYLNKGDYSKALDEVEQALPEIDRIVTTYMENKTRERKSTEEKREKGEKKQKAEYEESKEGKELKVKIKEVVKEVSTIKEQLKALKDKYGDKLDDALKARIDSVVNSLEKIEKKYNNAKETKKEVKKEEETKKEVKKEEEAKNKYIKNEGSEKLDREKAWDTITNDNKYAYDILELSVDSEKMTERKGNIKWDLKYKKDLTDKYKEESKIKIKEYDDKIKKNNKKIKALRTKAIDYIVNSTNDEQLEEAYNRSNIMKNTIDWGVETLSEIRWGNENKYYNIDTWKEKIIRTPYLSEINIKKLEEEISKKENKVEDKLRDLQKDFNLMADLYHSAKLKRERLIKQNKLKEPIIEKPQPQIIKDEVIITPYDNKITSEKLSDSYRNTSFYPNKRGSDDYIEYVNDINDINDEFSQWATEENIDEMREDLEKFKQGYISYINKLTAARGKTASSIITGATNFPYDRNKKNIENEVESGKKLSKYFYNTLDKLRRKYNPALATKIIRSDDLKAIDKIKEKIERKERNVERYKLLLKLKKDIKLSMKDKIDKLKDEMRKINYKKYDEYTDKDLEKIINESKKWMVDNERQEIYRLNDRIKSLEKEKEKQKNMTEVDKVKEVKGVKIIENTKEQRIQLKFPEKPDDETIKNLKRNGFSWSNKNKAWQRLLNNSSRYAAENIMKNYKESE